MEGVWAGALVGWAEAGRERVGEKEGCSLPAELTQQLRDSSLQASFRGRVGRQPGNPVWGSGF